MPLWQARRDQSVGGESLGLESIGTTVRSQIDERHGLAVVAEMSAMMYTGAPWPKSYFQY